jgi:hypothetical protein
MARFEVVWLLKQGAVFRAKRVRCASGAVQAIKSNRTGNAALASSTERLQEGSPTTVSARCYWTAKATDSDGHLWAQAHSWS